VCVFLWKRIASKVVFLLLLFFSLSERAFFVLCMLCYLNWKITKRRERELKRKKERIKRNDAGNDRQQQQ
jgi:hypothetical protein